VRTEVADISEMGRNTQGVRLVNLKDGDRLVALEVVSENDLERYATEEARIERKRPPLILDEGPDEEPADDSQGPEDDAPAPEKEGE